MLTMITVIGIDPGPITGIVVLHLGSDGGDRASLTSAEAVQVTHGAVPLVLTGLYMPPVALGMERFVVGFRSGRAKTPEASRVVQSVETAAWNWAADRSIFPNLRSASEVKPWATDVRLVKAGLMGITAGMRHARDAARHALFEAVKNHGLPDPLSKLAGR